MHKIRPLRKPNVTKEEHDLTTGNLFKKLILFTLPILFTSILSELFTTADLFTVSRFGGGSISMGAIGATTAVINILLCIFLGISAGANVVCANAKGAGDKIKAFRAEQSSIVIAVIFGLFIMGIGIPLSRPLLTLLNTSAEMIDKASLYLEIYMLGVPFMMVYNFGSAILRAFGDSKRPLYCLIFAGVFNVFLNIFLVAICKLDVLGVAIATDVSNVFASIAVIFFMIKDRHLFVNFTFRRFKLYKEETKEVLKYGVSNGFEGFVFNITNLIIQYSINSFGSSCISGCTISSNIEGYQFFVLSSISTAALAMFSQNDGARKKDNYKKTFKNAMLLELIALTAVGLLIFLLREPLIGLFLDKADPNYTEIMSFATPRIIIISLTYFLCGFLYVFSAYYRGLKYPYFPMIVTMLGTAVFRIVFLFTLFNLPYFHTITWLFLLYPMSWVLTLIVYIIPFKKKSDKAFAKYDIIPDLSEHLKVLAKYEEPEVK